VTYKCEASSNDSPNNLLTGRQVRIDTDNFKYATVFISFLKVNSFVKQMEPVS
jgi:hypothetical protein